MLQPRDVVEAPAGLNKADVLVLVSAVVLIGAFLFREIVDADTWWQVAIGRDILSTFSVPATDHFATAALGRNYHDSHWLFQVLLAMADRIGGMKGVWATMVLLWTGTFFFCFRAISRWIAVAPAAIVLFLAALACSDRFTPRPDLVTCLMIALFYWRLQEGKYRTIAELCLLGVLQVVWTNSHGLFVVGPFIGACYLAGAWVRRLREGSGDAVPELKLFALLLIASFVSPFGFGGWKYAFLLMTEAGAGAPEFFRSLAELSPTFGRDAWSLPDFWCFLLLLVLTLVAVCTGALRRQVPLSRLLVVAGLFAAAATGRRNMPLFALAAAPFAAEQLRHYGSTWLPSWSKGILALLLLLSSWFPLSGSYYRMIGYPARFGAGATPSLFPHSFPGFFRKSGLKGPLYNSNYLGGFCLYHGIRPLVDGRWETYDPAVLKKIFSAPFDSFAWEQIVAEYDIQGALLMHTSPEAEPLLPRLKNDARWRLVYYDNASSFWVRADKAPASPPAAVSIAALGSVPFPRAEDYLMVASFLRGIGAYREGIWCLQRTSFVGRDAEKALEMLGRLQNDAGLSQDAEATYKRLLQRNPRSTAALNELAFFAFSRGNLQEAEGYLRQALRIKPEDAEVAANLKRVVQYPRNGAVSP